MRQEIDQGIDVMKTVRTIAAFFTSLVITIVGIALAGCASTRHANTEQMLSAVGFQTMTPRTPQQQACYAALPPYKVERSIFNGKVVYAYADKRAGIVYVGNEKDYQQLQWLAFERKIAAQQLATAEMNEQAVLGWPFSGPPGLW